jgi:hypothetical protein
MTVVVFSGGLIGGSTMLGFQFLSEHCGFSVEMAGGIMARVLQLDSQG